MVTVTHFQDLDLFNCELKLKLGTEENGLWIIKGNHGVRVL